MADGQYFAVWRGSEPGAFTSWKDCLNSISHEASPLFKKFDSFKEAETAVKEPALKHFENVGAAELTESQKYSQESVSVGIVISQSIRFWAFDNKEVKLLFKSPNYDGVESDLVAFLAIVQTMEYMRLKEDVRSIYCMNKTAIKWVKSKKHSSLFKVNGENEPFLKKIEKAELLLSSHTYLNEVI